jgi:hypothetical protein
MLQYTTEINYLGNPLGQAHRGRVIRFYSSSGLQPSCGVTASTPVAGISLALQMFIQPFAYTD